MKSRTSMKRTAHVVFSLVMLFSLLLPATPAFAQSKTNGNQKNDPPQAQPKKEDDKQSAPAQTTTQQSSQTQSSQTTQSSSQPVKGSTDTQPIDTPCDQTQSRHPSGNDRCVENGKSGTQTSGTIQGKSTSDPDQNGKGPERNAVGTRTPDKPGGQGGVIRSDQDGNNGCGNDQDFEDDNEGWCGGKPKQVQPAPTPTPPGDVRGSTSVHVVGCYEWKDSHHRFFIDEEMSEGQAKQFDKDTNFVSDKMEGCKNEAPPPTQPEQVHIVGCFKDMGHVDQWLPKDQAEKFLKDHDRIPCEGTKPAVDENHKVNICHRTASDKNPWVLIEVSVNAQGHIDHDKFDIHAEDRIFWNGLPNGFTEAMCNPGTSNTPTPPGGTLGSTDDNPNPPSCTSNCGGDTPKSSTESQPVTLYGCYRKPNGSYQHYNMTFGSEAEKSAFERDNGLTVDASRPNPEQCKTEQPPAQNASVPPSDNPAQTPPPPPSGGVLSVIDEEGNPPSQMITIATTEAAPSVPAVITTDQARDQSPVVDVFPPARELGIVSEQPAAPAAPVVANAPQPANPAAPQPLTTFLPTTGEPLLDLALLTLGFIVLTFLGLRFLRAGVKRA